MSDHETPTHRTEQWVLDATDGYCPTCLSEELHRVRGERNRLKLFLDSANEVGARWKDLCESAEADLQRVRGALEEIMPRYREMFEALNLGDFTQSVAYQIAKAALTGHATGEKG